MSVGRYPNSDFRVRCPGCGEKDREWTLRRDEGQQAVCDHCGAIRWTFFEDRGTDSSPFVGEVYRSEALRRGRPTEPCECRACDCDLHTYPGDVGCIWCSNGQHANDRDGVGHSLIDRLLGRGSA